MSSEIYEYTPTNKPVITAHRHRLGGFEVTNLIQEAPGSCAILRYSHENKTWYDTGGTSKDKRMPPEIKMLVLETFSDWVKNSLAESDKELREAYFTQTVHVSIRRSTSKINRSHKDAVIVQVTGIGIFTAARLEHTLHGLPGLKRVHQNSLDSNCFEFVCVPNKIGCDLSSLLKREITSKMVARMILKSEP